MSQIDERLNQIESVITKPDFRKNMGLGNEVGYYIFDYNPKDELHVRSHIDYLINKFSRFDHDVKIVEFDLYDITIDLLKQKNYLDKCFKFEESKDSDYVYNAIAKMLKLTDRNNLLIKHIMENTPDGCVVFLTGIGKCYPIVRSHTILNNLHQVLDKVPVVMFFPGEYNGQYLRLFGIVEDSNYYRAFKLV